MSVLQGGNTVKLQRSAAICLSVTITALMLVIKMLISHMLRTANIESYFNFY